MFKYIFPVALILFGANSLVEDITEKRATKAFLDHGQTATILPITEYQAHQVTQYRRYGGEKDLGVAYYADIAYVTKAGEKVVVPSIPLPPYVYDQSKSGKPVSIEYLPESPTTIRFAYSVPYDGDVRLFIYAVLAFGLYLFYRAWTANRREAEAE